ncbi:MAG: MFS transporter [Deltaproteobacteria bacterium]|nr:MFS transporter [Deltaproteobacteria bacterium]
MAVSRAAVVEDNFQRFVREREAGPPCDDLDGRVRPGSRLTGRLARRLFEAQLESRILDLLARELKNDGQSYYTIGSAGHEGNAAVAGAMGPDDWAFLHYRSGAFWCARAAGEPGAPRGGRSEAYRGDGAFDVLLGLCASADEPVAGGRHKVFGSYPLHIPPQTSTIASQLPKAVGFAVAIDRRARLLGVEEHRISVVSFGDASSNHSVAVGAINAARWTAYQNVPVPVLFVCEDNGIGISTHTPDGWVGHTWGNQPDLAYFEADGLDLASAYDAATAAVDSVRERRKPAFLHLRTVRLLGHAGSDVEQLYHTEREIAAAEQRDPLLVSAALLIDGGFATPAEIAALYAGLRARLGAQAREAVRRPKITSRETVVAPLFRHDPDAVRRSVPVAAAEVRDAAFNGKPPESDERPRHLAWHINRALLDLLLARPEMILFGEDVAKKGGVYHVTAELTAKVGVGRVFNSLLDETSILGLAIGAGHAGLLPFPEIQYLAYLTNAIDQLRGEAGSMQFFSQGQFANPMVVRIAGLAYQKGFGGHFHNDNGIAQIREIPGLLGACPSRGDDAARMLRTLASAAIAHGRTCLFLEPIALYMTKDLHADGDGGWLARYPAPSESLAVGEVGVYDEGEGDAIELVIATYANGLWMSLRAARRSGRRIRVIDLRWLLPLPHDALEAHVRQAGRLLVVDECRRHSGIADEVAAEMAQRVPAAEIRMITAPDTYIPLAAAANLVLVQEADIEAGIADLVPRRTRVIAEMHP